MVVYVLDNQQKAHRCMRKVAHAIIIGSTIVLKTVSKKLQWTETKPSLCPRDSLTQPNLSEKFLAVTDQQIAFVTVIDNDYYNDCFARCNYFSYRYLL